MTTELHKLMRNQLSSDWVIFCWLCDRHRGGWWGSPWLKALSFSPLGLQLSSAGCPQTFTFPWQVSLLYLIFKPCRFWRTSVVGRFSFRRFGKIFHCITSAWLVSESLHTDSEMVNQPAQDILIAEKPDLDDLNLLVLQAVEHQVLDGNHEATWATDILSQWVSKNKLFPDANENRSSGGAPLPGFHRKLV